MYDTIVKTACPIDGDVEVLAEAVELTIYSIREWSHYAFTCPLCSTRVQRSAAADAIVLLRSANVPTVIIQVPAEALEPHEGSMITTDDVLDFVLALDDITDMVAAMSWKDHT